MYPWPRGRQSPQMLLRPLPRAAGYPHPKPADRTKEFGWALAGGLKGNSRPRMNADEPLGTPHAAQKHEQPHMT